jgi:hypothetical protein
MAPGPVTFAFAAGATCERSDDERIHAACVPTIERTGSHVDGSALIRPENGLLNCIDIAAESE